MQRAVWIIHSCPRTHKHAATIIHFWLLITSMLNCCCDPPVVISATSCSTLPNCVSAGAQVPQSAWPAARLQRDCGFCACQGVITATPISLSVHRNETAVLMVPQLRATEWNQKQHPVLHIDYTYFGILEIKHLFKTLFTSKLREYKTKQVQTFAWLNDLFCFNSPQPQV